MARHSHELPAVDSEKLIGLALSSVERALHARLKEEARTQKDLLAALEGIRARLRPALTLIHDGKGEKEPKDPIEFIEHLQRHGETEDLVTPEILDVVEIYRARMEALGSLGSTLNGNGKEKRGVRKKAEKPEARQPELRTAVKEMNERRRTIVLQRLKATGQVKNDEALRKAFGCSVQAAKLYLAKLAKEGLLRKEGGESGPSVYYVKA